MPAAKNVSDGTRSILILFLFVFSAAAAVAAVVAAAAAAVVLVRNIPLLAQKTDHRNFVPLRKLLLLPGIHFLKHSLQSCTFKLNTLSLLHSS